MHAKSVRNQQQHDKNKFLFISLETSFDSFLYTNVLKEEVSLKEKHIESNTNFFLDENSMKEMDERKGLL